MVLDTRGDNEELALIHRASNGDHEAFRLLVLSYEAQLLAYLMHMLGDRDSAYDVAQDTFVAVYYALPRWHPLLFNDTASITQPPIHKQLLDPWLYRIATNKAISLLRKNSFYARRSVQQDNEYRWEELLKDQSPSSRERVAKEVELAMVERHIANCAICQQTIVETSRIFTLLSTLTHSDTPLNNSVFKQPSSLADAVLSQLVQGKSIDDNETIEVIARPFLTLPGVISTEINNESFDDHAGTHSRIPWIRKHESRRQQESGRNMNIIFVPKFGRDKSGPYAWFATIVATVLILFIIGGGLMLLVRMAQHTTTGLSPSGATGQFLLRFYNCYSSS